MCYLQFQNLITLNGQEILQTVEKQFQYRMLPFLNYFPPVSPTLTLKQIFKLPVLNLSKSFNLAFREAVLPFTLMFTYVIVNGLTS